MARAGGVRAREDLTLQRALRELLERQLKDAQVIFCVVGSRVAGPQDAGEDLPATAHEQRIEAEAALVVAGRPLLLGVRGDRRRVEVDDHVLGRRACLPFHDLAEHEIVELKDYIIRREAALDRDLLPYGDPQGKRVLVFGCGYGNEVLWAVRHGARSVLATDLSPGLSPVPFERAMAEVGLNYTEYEFRRENIHDTAQTGDQFDLIVSNGVFEHVHDLKGVLGALRPLLRPGGRIAIFADGLWYSSIGGHIGKGPWEHLYRDPIELKTELTERRWDVFCNQLNRMTVSDFLNALRSVGLLVLQFKLGCDPNFSEIASYLPSIRSRLDVSPADLSIVSIGCELCFVEHI